MFFDVVHIPLPHPFAEIPRVADFLTHIIELREPKKWSRWLESGDNGRRVRVRKESVQPWNPEDAEDHHRTLLGALEERLSPRGWSLGPDGWWGGGQEADISSPPDLFVCTACTGIVEIEDGVRLPEACPCDRFAGMAHGDVRLCYCCGQVLLARSSKFSVWFCKGCMAHVRTLNARLRRYAIPIGEHSIHAGYLLPGDAGDVDIEIFAAGWKDITSAMDPVREWGGLVRRRVIEERWSEPPPLVPIGVWDRRLDREEQNRKFGQMIAFMQEQTRS